MNKPGVTQEFRVYNKTEYFIKGGNLEPIQTLNLTFKGGRTWLNGDDTIELRPTNIKNTYVALSPKKGQDYILKLMVYTIF